jgi:hypothetical protein
MDRAALSPLLRSFERHLRQIVSVQRAEICQYCQGSSRRLKITALLGR